MNDLDRYAVSLENMEVLRAQVEVQAREIERFELACKAHEKHREAVTNSGANLDASTQSYIESLEQELAALKAQPGEAVAWRVTGRGGITVTEQYPEWAESDRLLTITPLYARLNQQARAALSANHSEQVRHTALEGVTFERDVFGTIHIKSGEFDFIQIRYQYPYTDNSGTWKLAERIVALLAAPSAGSQEQG